MYKITEKIENIRRFDVKYDNLILIKKNKVFFNNNLLDDKIISAGFIDIKNNFLLLLNYQNKKVITDNKLSQINEFNKKDIIYNDIFYRELNNKLASLNTKFNIDGSTEFNWVILNILNGKIIKDLKIKKDILGFYYINKNETIYRTNNSNKLITSFDFFNNEILWQFDLSQLGTFYSEQSQQQEAYKVEKFIGIHQDRLYVALNGGMLLEIDIATGELTHQWQNIMTTDRGFSYPVEPNTFTMDKQLGKLVSFYTSDFITIDLSNKKVNITPLDEELNKFDGMTFRPTPDNYAIDATHIYTIVTLNAPEEDFIKQSIVAFNKQTKKIDWHYTDNQFSVDGSSPKIAGNKLYQKVNVSNLYIFEKTSNESI